MDVLVALAISIGILITGWTYVALGVAALPVRAGIVAWGLHFRCRRQDHRAQRVEELRGRVRVALLGAAAAASVVVGAMTRRPRSAAV